MKLKIHNRYYNWAHIREIYPSAKYGGENCYFPQIVIWMNGQDSSFNFNFNSAEFKKSTENEALEAAKNILDEAMAEMA